MWSAWPHLSTTASLDWTWGPSNHEKSWQEKCQHTLQAQRDMKESYEQYPSTLTWLNRKLNDKALSGEMNRSWNPSSVKAILDTPVEDTSELVNDFRGRKFKRPLAMLILYHRLVHVCVYSWLALHAEYESCVRREEHRNEAFLIFQGHRIGLCF